MSSLPSILPSRVIANSASTLLLPPDGGRGDSDAVPISANGTTSGEQQEALRESQARLREAQARLDAALSAGEIGTWTIDVPNDRVTGDIHVAHLFSVDLEDTVAGSLNVQAFLDAIHEEDRVRMTQNLANAMGSGRGDYHDEYRVVRPEGGHRWLTSRGKIDRDAAGKPVSMSGAVVDITERKDAVEALARSEARFRVQADAMPQMVWATDSKGNHLYYNRRWYEYTGQTVEESMGFGFARALHPDDHDRTLNRWRRAYEDNEDYDIEYRFRRHDGTYRWFVGRAEPVRDPETGLVTMWAGTCTDIDELKRAQDALEQVSRQLRGIVFSMTEGLIVTDMNGDVVEFNPAALAMIGYDKDALEQIKKTPAQLSENFETYDEEGNALPPDEWPLMRALRGETFTGLRVRVRRADTGLGIWASVGGAGVQDSNGRQTLALITVREITQQVEAEKERAAAFAKNERIAETLQRSMLVAPPPDRFPGIELATDYEAAWDEAQVGGDFYDTFALAGGAVAFVVGDATGKGLEAAAHTAEVKYVLRAYLHESPDPAVALGRLNRFLVDGQRLGGKGMDGPSFMAIAVTVLHPETGEARCACAGAEPPLLVRTSTGTAEEIDARGALIGASHEAQYDTVTFTIEVGDLLVMTTDGITEARNFDNRRTFFGDKEYAKAAQEALPESVMLGEAAKNITARAKAFAGGKLHDDVCLLLVRRRNEGYRPIETGKL
ncbi:MAG: SpoIIE family protein phosphatase [Fibrella sp.]|nr:SpoIIE family protein phosphatase [Armatimonadota bacterium]